MTPQMIGCEVKIVDNSYISHLTYEGKLKQSSGMLTNARQVRVVAVNIKGIYAKRCLEDELIELDTIVMNMDTRECYYVNSHVSISTPFERKPIKIKKVPVIPVTASAVHYPFSHAVIVTEGIVIAE